jgi:hypothetical protein
MKYFTMDLCSKLNSCSPEVKAQADIDWTQNAFAYDHVFNGIKDRLSKKFLLVYNSNLHFHDFEFITFAVVQPKRWAKDPVIVQIVISGRNGVWMLTYKQVTKVIFNFTSDQDKYLKKWGVHTWGYDEFLPVDENYLSHEILFASGANILVHFKNRNVYIEKIILSDNYFLERV